MLRKVIAGASASALMAVGLVGATPVPSAEAAKFEDWGFVKSKNHTIKRGCHKYVYRYKIDPPAGDVRAGEIFLVAPDGTGLASAAKIEGANKLKGKARFKLCSRSFSAGKYKLKMKVTYREGFTTVEGFVKPTTFRFKRAKRR